jgi:23S rRNA (guanosine2251-2'-O)-methyltransferase
VKRPPREERRRRDSRREQAPRTAAPERSREERRPRREHPPRERAAEQQPRLPGGGGRYVYGINPVLETLRARPDEIEHLYLAEGSLNPTHAAEILSRARDAGVRLQKVARERLAVLADGGVHQGVVAEVAEYAYADVPDLLEAAAASGRPALIVVLDGIQDPQNLGAIIRSAYAIGAHGVIVGKDRAAGVTGAVAKASAGAVEHCKVARVVNLSRAIEELKAAKLWIAAADPASTEPLWGAKLEGPLAIVVGAEGAGVRKGVLDHCDFRLNIPMEGKLGSLNASVSAAVMLYEVARQRKVRSG